LKERPGYEGIRDGADIRATDTGGGFIKCSVAAGWLIFLCIFWPLFIAAVRPHTHVDAWGNEILARLTGGPRERGDIEISIAAVPGQPRRLLDGSIFRELNFRGCRSFLGARGSAYRQRITIRAIGIMIRGCGSNNGKYINNRNSPRLYVIVTKGAKGAP